MQTIDEAAKEFSSYEPAQIGFKAGIAFAQRWISVEEELPEVDYNEPYPILIKKDKIYNIFVLWIFSPNDIEMLKTSFKFWRPINLK